MQLWSPMVTMRNASFFFPLKTGALAFDLWTPRPLSLMRFVDTLNWSSMLANGSAAPPGRAAVAAAAGVGPFLPAAPFPPLPPLVEEGACRHQ